LDVAQVSAGGCDFRLRQQGRSLLAEVSSAGPLPPHVEVRATEALRFVLARRLSWYWAHAVTDSVETITIMPWQRVPPAQLLPPISGGPPLAAHVWRLFQKYLEFVLRHGEPYFHPCSRYLSAVMEASAGSIAAKGLALGVAVEGLAKALFPEKAEASPALKAAVKDLKRHVEAWPGGKGLESGPGLLRRLPGYLDQLLGASTKDLLYALAARRVIREEHIKTWGELRNAAAHAAAIDPRPDQRFIDRCNTVTVLMYHLVFRAIGYEGLYSDYSTYEYPFRRYRGRPPTHEETQLAAYTLWRKSGCTHGHDINDWLEAERLLAIGVLSPRRPSGLNLAPPTCRCIRDGGGRRVVAGEPFMLCPDCHGKGLV
jgi:hypothetical protein